MSAQILHKFVITSQETHIWQISFAWGNSKISLFAGEISFSATLWLCLENSYPGHLFHPRIFPGFPGFPESYEP